MVNEGTGHWVCCYWEKMPSIEVDTPRIGRVYSGLLFIPSPFGDIISHEGLWSEINEQFGTMLEMWEEERIEDPVVLEQIARFIHEFAKKYEARATEKTSVTSLWRIEGTQRIPITVEMPSNEIMHWLGELASFLLESAQRKKVVCIDL